MIKKVSIIIFLCMQSLYAAPGHVYIIIHGTWAAQSSWAKPGGDFFTQLADSVQGFQATVVTFSWSGGLDNESRRRAGKKLAAYIQGFPFTTTLHIIGHSHGANVGILACNELACRNSLHTIETFYALAAPVNTHEYMPNMGGINYFYNFFSLNDLVQPVLGIFGRIYPQHPRIANIRIMLNGKQPDHDQLHNPWIAQWLVSLHRYLSGTLVEYTQPMLINFTQHSQPLISLDSNREELLAEDRKLIAHLLTVFRRKKYYSEG